MYLTCLLIHFVQLTEDFGLAVPHLLKSPALHLNFGTEVRDGHNAVVFNFSTKIWNNPEIRTKTTSNRVVKNRQSS